MATDPGDGEREGTPLDRFMADLRRELVRRVARRDRENHRDIYDALADE